MLIDLSFVGSNATRGALRLIERRNRHGWTVDTHGQSQACPDLWVIGGGKFPSFGGYNPTLTIQALAYRAAELLLEGGGATMEPLEWARAGTR